MNTVLVVEDDHDTRVQIRNALEFEGFNVCSATNGVDALSLLRRLKSVSVVVLDQNLPLMSGDDFMAVKCREPELAPIPVIVISAIHDRITPLYPNRTSYLAKPFQVNALLERVSRHCVRPGPALPNNIPSALQG